MHTEKQTGLGGRGGIEDQRKVNVIVSRLVKLSEKSGTYEQNSHSDLRRESRNINYHLLGDRVRVEVMSRKKKVGWYDQGRGQEHEVKTLTRARQAVTRLGAFSQVVESASVTWILVPPLCSQGAVVTRGTSIVCVVGCSHWAVVS